MSVAKVIIIGHMGNTPSINELNDGRKYCKISVATNDSYKKGEEWIETTCWHPLTLWGPLAERGGNLEKGDLVQIEGKILGYSTWKDRDGNCRAQPDINIQSLVKLAGKSKDTKDPF